MELRNIQSFVAAVDTGSMANAAKACNLTISAISKHIKDLETTLGVQLLIRHKNDIKLSEYGEAFIIHARSIIREEQKARDEIAALHGELTGDLYIGAGSFIEPFLWPAIVEFMTRHPKVKVHIQYNYAHELNRKLRENTIDLAITMNTAYSNEGIQSEQCFKFQLYAIMGDNNKLAQKEKITFEDIYRSRILMPDTGARELATMQQYTTYNIQKIVNSSVYECNNSNFLLNSIYELNAITFMPKEYIEHRKNLVARPIIGFEVILTSNAHWIAKSPLKESAKALLTIIHEQSNLSYSYNK